MNVVVKNIIIKKNTIKSKYIYICMYTYEQTKKKIEIDRSRAADNK